MFRAVDPFDKFLVQLVRLTTFLICTSTDQCNSQPFQRHLKPFLVVYPELRRSHFSLIATSFHLLIDSIGYFRLGRKAHATRPGTAESSLRDQRMDSLRALHSRPPTREASPSRSVRLMDEGVPVSASRSGSVGNLRALFGVGSGGTGTGVVDQRGMWSWD